MQGSGSSSAEAVTFDLTESSCSFLSENGVISVWSRYSAMSDEVFRIPDFPTSSELVSCVRASNESNVGVVSVDL